MADAIAITKADGDQLKAAKATQVDFQHALHMLHAQPSGWVPKVVTCSAQESRGIREIIAMINAYKEQLSVSGFFGVNRQNQQTLWFRDYFYYLLSLDPKQFQEVSDAEANLKDLVAKNQLSPRHAARSLLDAYHKAIAKRKP